MSSCLEFRLSGLRWAVLSLERYVGVLTASGRLMPVPSDIGSVLGLSRPAVGWRLAGTARLVILFCFKILSITFKCRRMAKFRDMAITLV